MSVSTAAELELSPLHVNSLGTVLIDRIEQDVCFDRDTGEHTRIVKTARSWWVTVNGSLVTTSSRLRTGMSRPKHGEPKRFWTWETTELMTLRRTRHGYWLLTKRGGRGGRVTDRVFDLGGRAPTILTTVGELFPERVRVMGGWGTGGPGSMSDVFRFLEHYESFRRSPQMWRTGFRRADDLFVRSLVGAATARDVATSLFGRTRVNRALVKAVADPELTCGQLELVWALRGLVPTDWLVERLRTRAPVDSGASRLRPVLRLLPATVRRRLLRQNTYAVRDMVMMVAEGNHRRLTNAVLARVRSWTDLHDALSKGVVESRSRWSVPVPLRALEGGTGTCTLRFLRKHAALVETGALLDNCIGSYASQAERGRSVLAAVEGPDGALLGAVELQRVSGDPSPSWRLAQLLGRFNRRLDKAVHDEIVEHLVSGGTVTASGFYDGRV